MERKPFETVTVYDIPVVRGAAGVSRTVTGSRHSSLPAIVGSTRRTVAGSTMRSSDPATGRSKVTVICASGLASRVGPARMTRSGGLDIPGEAGAFWATRRGTQVSARSARSKRAEGIDRNLKLGRAAGGAVSV